MKKNLFIAFAALLCISLFQSCNDDKQEYADLNYNRALVTVKPISEGEYYFVLDDSKTIYPTNKDYIGRYKGEEGQRAFIDFGFLNGATGQYDYHVELYRIHDILTKQPKSVATQEELDKLGDDKLEIVRNRYDENQIWISGGHLNINFGLMAGTGSQHEMNLVVNQVGEPAPDTEGYTNVEFRQKATGNSGSTFSTWWVSFRLGELDPTVSGSKGLRVRVKTHSGELKYYNIEPQKEGDTDNRRFDGKL